MISVSQPNGICCYTSENNALLEFAEINQYINFIIYLVLTIWFDWFSLHAQEMSVCEKDTDPVDPGHLELI